MKSLLLHMIRCKKQRRTMLPWLLRPRGPSRVTRMPKGPKGEKRPADVIGNAVHVLRIATGEMTHTGGVPFLIS